MPECIPNTAIVLKKTYDRNVVQVWECVIAGAGGRVKGGCMGWGRGENV
jgi:hypothetical protein